MSGPRLLIAGGGTGGHLFPALAVAEAWEARFPDGEILFVGTERGIEARVLPQQGRALATLRVGQMKGGGALARLRTVAGLPSALLQALGVVRRFRPDVVLGVGGYASAPAVAAAGALGIPALLHEQNALPGMANRWLSRLARRVLVSFPEAVDHFPPGKAVVTGNPVRKALAQAARDGRHGARDGGAAAGFTLLVFGGSLGARVFSRVVPEAVALVQKADAAALSGLRVVQQARQEDLEALTARYRVLRIDARVVPFIDDMAAAYAAADLVICRAGATSVAELTVMGQSALLIPYPYAADDHQAYNARSFADAGAGWMCREGAFTPEWLAAFLAQRLADRAGLARAGERAFALARPGAAVEIVEQLAALRKERAHHV